MNPNDNKTPEMNIPPDPHRIFREQIASYLTSGLGAEESDRFTAHAAVCPPCAAALAEARSADAAMLNLFDRPAAGLEDRVIQTLRRARPSRLDWLQNPIKLKNMNLSPMKLNPKVLRAASGVAAAIVLGTLGFYASKEINGGGQAQLVTVAANLKMLGTGAINYGFYSGELPHKAAADFRQIGPARVDGKSPSDPFPRTVFMMGSPVQLSNVSPPPKDGQNVVNTEPQIARDNYQSASGTVDLKGLTGGLRSNVERTVGDPSLSHLSIADQNHLIHQGEEVAQNPIFGINGANTYFGGTTISGGQLVTGKSAKDTTTTGSISGTGSLQQWNGGLLKLDTTTAKPLSDDLAQFDGTHDTSQPNTPKLPAAEFFKPGQQIAMDYDGDGIKAGLRDKWQVGNGQQLNSFSAVATNYSGTIQPTVGALSLGGGSTVSNGVWRAGHDFSFGTAPMTPNLPGLVDINGKTPVVTQLHGDGKSSETAPAANPFNGGFTLNSPNNTSIAGVTLAGVNTSSADSLSISSGNAIGGISPAGVINKRNTVTSGSDVGAPFQPEDNKAPGQNLAVGVVAADAPRTQTTPANPVNPAAPVAVAQVPIGAQPVPAPAQPAPTQPAPIDIGRQIIRHGDMSFDVDSFDSAALQVRKIALEESGFIASSSSEKLANGKVAGVVTVRVPPEHLDSLVTKLRGLGDLKGQKIVSDDVSKQYSDLQSQLRAAKAMEERLMEIIKTGKGEVKDLVAAEKEMGTWREKDEQLTGEINYYNSLVALSTLEISLSERDIRQAALATETETVNMGVETDDVEKARAEALKAIDQIKGRVIQSDLKKFDAGQLAATIKAEVDPASSGLVIDRLKQLGRVARMDINRQQSSAGNAAVPQGVKVERQQTVLVVSLYNLANVAARETTNLSLASDDVEKAYHAVIARVATAGGRVVDSSLNRAKPDQISAAINFETPADKADAVLNDVRALGEVLHLTVTENPDAANVTASKRGFVMTLASLATVAPRETITTTLMPGGNVADAYRAILSTAQAVGANITTANLQEQNSQSAAATLVLDITRVHFDQMQQSIASALGSGGRVLSRQSARSADTEHTIDSKIQLQLTFASPDTLGPRESIGRVLAVGDVPTTYETILATAQQSAAKIITAKLDQSDPHNVQGQLVFVISKAGADAVEKAITAGKAAVVSRAVNRAPDVNTTTDEKTEIRLVIDDVEQLPPRQTTVMGVEVADVEKESADLQAAALAAGGRVVEQNLSKSERYQAHLVIDVPMKSAGTFIDRARGLGNVKNIDQTKNNDLPDAEFVHARLDLTLLGPGQLVDSGTGLWSSLMNGLGTSFKGLAYSVEMIVVGLCLVLPWALLLWGGWKVFRRTRVKPVVM
jgi:hypothetical protein